jgi:hypothetical protein
LCGNRTTFDNGATGEATEDRVSAQIARGQMLRGSEQRRSLYHDVALDHLASLRLLLLFVRPMTPRKR